MSENEQDIVNFIKTKICPLTDDKCYEALDKFKEHENIIKLVDDVFEGLIKCDSDKCKANESEIKEVFETFIKENEESLL